MSETPTDETVLYELFYFKSPFIGATEEETFKNIREAEVCFDDTIRMVPDSAKELISLLLKKNMVDRPKASELTQHEFITKFLNDDEGDKGKKERIVPLGMHDTFYLPADSLKPRIAPTEQYPPRGHPAHGEVHDETAYTIGGVSGNAGLFSTATDLAIFAQMMLNRGSYGGVRIVQDATVRRFTTVVAENRTYGWMSVAAGEQGSGEFLGPNTYGHAGYTGTSLWIDPDRQLFVIILTNRVHEARARRPGIIIADVRHDVADVAALAITDVPTLRAVAWPRELRVDQRPDWNPPTRTLVRRPTTLPRQGAASSPETDRK